MEVLLTTPLVLCSLLDSKGVSLARVQTLILDEADRLFEMGFVRQVDQIIAACSHPDVVSTQRGWSLGMTCLGVREV